MTAEITVIITNYTSRENVTASLLNEINKNTIDPSSESDLSEVAMEFVFELLPYGFYNLSIENHPDSLFCQLRANKTEYAKCTNETSDEFSVTWAESSLFVPLEVKSTDPAIEAITNQSNSFTFSGLDSGYGYNVHHVRSSKTDGVETLIYEELNCLTQTTECNFTGNSYIEVLPLKNKSSDEIEITVAFKDSCNSCKWQIDDNYFKKETDVDTINTFNSNGNLTIQVINSTQG